MRYPRTQNPRKCCCLRRSRKSPCARGAPRRGRLEQLLRCQYLYFCSSKASKLRTSSSPPHVVVGAAEEVARVRCLHSTASERESEEECIYVYVERERASERARERARERVYVCMYVGIYVCMFVYVFMYVCM